MNNTFRSPAIFLSLFFLIFGSTAVFSQDKLHQFTEGLSIPLSGNYGREAVFQDELLWHMAEGNWTSPKEGAEAFAKGDGDAVKWMELSSNEKGLFRHKNLRGGYMYCEYKSKKSEIVILEVSGHNEVYVNGQPRGGDVYNYGWVQHPVQLEKGVNRFLFRGSRGQLKASLTKPKAKLFVSERDPLIPDYVEDWTGNVLGAVRLINASSEAVQGYKIVSYIDGKQNQLTEIPEIGPLTSRKVPFSIKVENKKSGEKASLSFKILNSKDKEIGAQISPEFNVNVKGKFDRRKETFISEIDGSVQYYSLVPTSEDNLEGPALFYSLHGASVEAVNQAAAYSPKNWGLLVAPTNRRPYGFDWEDWGRLDAKEVLNRVVEKYKPDPSRMYLTGHSMGGHGTWQFGVTYPDYWAAIAPSAGWYSFWSYAGKEHMTAPKPMELVFQRASNPSNTLALSDNYLHYGIYVLHGDADDNVPVSQARFMREHLAKYHSDFAYYERPGAGHWWGNECVDWPPLFQFMKDHKRPELKDVKKYSFTTSSPGVSADSRFTSIWQQKENLEMSKLDVNQDIANKIISIETENVLVLKIDLAHLQNNQPYDIVVEKDSFKVEAGKDVEVFFENTSSGWKQISKPGNDQKGPHRSGLFKEAFQHKMVFVYGTNGTKEENEWAYNKARFDAETFWYRGNGSIDVLSDEQFAARNMSGRNVILYGHSDMNSAWENLLPESEIKVTRGEVKFGTALIEGDDLSVCFIAPVEGSDYNSVGVIAGTGISAMKASYPNRYFVSGAGYPDFMVYRSTMLKDGIDGVVAAGFFDRNWKLSEKDINDLKHK